MSGHDTDHLTPITSADVAKRFDAYPPAVRRSLMALRGLIFRIAGLTEGVGALEESLKWGDPSYVPRSGSGSPFRIGWKQSDPEHYAVYFHCQTNLVETFRTLFPDDFEFSGNRALRFRLGARLPEDALSECIAAALTYHRRKRTAVSGPRKKRA